MHMRTHTNACTMHAHRANLHRSLCVMSLMTASFLGSLRLSVTMPEFIPVALVLTRRETFSQTAYMPLPLPACGRVWREVICCL